VQQDALNFESTLDFHFFSDPQLKIWFAGQQNELQQQATTIAATEAASRTALQAKDAAQSAFEVAHRQHNANEQAVRQAQHTLEQIHTAIQNTQEQKRQSEQALAQTLAELAPAMHPLENLADWPSGWKIQWETAPEQFHMQCAQNAKLWLHHAKEREQLRESSASLSQQLSALQLAHTKAEAAQQHADQEF